MKINKKIKTSLGLNLSEIDFQTETFQDLSSGMVKNELSINNREKNKETGSKRVANGEQNNNSQVRKNKKTGSKQVANGEQTGSKSRKNKKTGSKRVANGEQTESKRVAERVANG